MEKIKTNVNVFVWLLLNSVVGILQEMWLAKGWGDNVEHVLDMIHLLLEVLQSLEPSILEMWKKLGLSL